MSVNVVCFTNDIAVLIKVPTASRLFWISLYKDSNKWKWFFHVDFALVIGYFAMYVVGDGMHTYILLVV